MGEPKPWLVVVKPSPSSSASANGAVMAANGVCSTVDSWAEHSVRGDDKVPPFKAEADYMSSEKPAMQCRQTGPNPSNHFLSFGKGSAELTTVQTMPAKKLTTPAQQNSKHSPSNSIFVGEATTVVAQCKAAEQICNTVAEKETWHTKAWSACDLKPDWSSAKKSRGTESPGQKEKKR